MLIQELRVLTRHALIVMCSATVACSAAISDAELKGILQAGLHRGYPGVAMETQSSNGRTHSAAVGYSDLEKHTLLRVDDAFQMASITKTFTAVAVLRLVDQGQLSLKATLKSQLGDAVARIPDADQITISQLLDHSSGIYPTNNDRDYVATVVGRNADPTRAWTPEELIALADRERNKPAGVPATGHFYSDTNYVLLGIIVQKVGGRPLQEQVRKTLLEPLGMHSTYFYSDYLGKAAQPPLRTVQGYLLATDELRSAVPINAMFKPVPGDNRKKGQLLNTTLAAERIDAAAGLVTTLPDLLKFASALFRGKLLSAQSQKFIMAASEDMARQPIDKERIWTLQAVRKSYGVLIYKDGDGPGGVNTLMAYCPATDEIYVGFTNIFGYFNEVDFLMDDVIGKIAASK